MKITKSHLRQIIREEIQNEANEGGEGVHDIFNLPEPEAVEPSGNPKEDALRQIVADKQYAKVEGVSVDLTTANMVLQLIDHHRKMAEKDPDTWEPRLEKFLSMPITGMIDFTFRVLGR